MTGKINLSLYIIGLAIIAYLLCDRGRIIEDRNKYKENTESLLTGIKRLQMDSSRNAVETNRLRLTINELEEVRSGYLKTIDELGIRIKQLQSVARQDIDLETPIAIKVDSANYLDIIEGKPIELFESDPYKDIKLTIKKDSVIGSVQMTANLTQYIYADYKHKFLWWMWGLRGVKQIVICDNPYIKINYSEYIEITN
jgi:hypothetical protein